MIALPRGAAPLLALVGAIGFSFKAILIKIAYGVHPVDPITLLALRMLYSAPFFLALAWWSQRGTTAPTARQWLAVVGLGFIGYYLSSYLDFLGLQYISAALERLVLFLYPTIVVMLSAAFLGKPISRRIATALLITYAGIVLVFWHDLRVAPDAREAVLGSALVFAASFTYAVYLVSAGPLIQRLGSGRFTAFAMLSSTVFVLAQFFAVRPPEALAQPPVIHAIALAMAVFTTVLPTLMIAEAIRHMGANGVALLGAVGPIATLVFGAILLAEPVGVLQLAGAALVVLGVLLVTLRR